MIRFAIVFCLALSLLSCRSTRKIQSAITRKDTIATVQSADTLRSDSMRLTRLGMEALNNLNANRINFTTFTAKVNVDYQGGDGKKYDLNANIRMYKDSAIWINVNALLGIDVMRVLVTKDSIKLLNKANKIYTERSIDYLQDVSALPLDLATLQDLIIGNPVFADSNIVSYSNTNNEISILILGKFFKNLLTISSNGKELLHSKLDDLDIARNRTADLTYGDYENKKGVNFSTKRRIAVAEKTRLDIRLEYKQYDFNTEVSFPFSVPKNYERN